MAFRLLQVAAQAILSPTRRRATDPGSPALPPRCVVRSLPASPMPPRLPASAPGSPGPPPGPRLARSPTRAPLTADRVQQRRRQRSRSAAATPVTDATQLHQRLAAAATAGAEQLLDSYHSYAAQLFERQFCPLRTGLQEQRPMDGEGPVLTRQQGLPAQCASQGQEQHTGESLPQQQQQQQQLATAAPASQQRTQRQRAPPQSQAVTPTPAGHWRSAQDASPGSASCSSGGSCHSFASEEGDVVQVASPERGELGGVAPVAERLLPRCGGLACGAGEHCCTHISHSRARPTCFCAGLPAGTPVGTAPIADAQPIAPQPGATAGAGRPAAAAPSRASVQRGGGEAQRLAASPLPLLSAALQLLTSPAGQPCSPEAIQPLRLAFEEAARGSADARAQQAVQQAVQQVAQPPRQADEAVAAEGAVSRAECSAAGDASLEPAEHHAAAGAGSSGTAAPVAGRTAPAPAMQPAAVAEGVVAEAAAAETGGTEAAPAGERPHSAGGRAQALQRLKQRRLLQRGDSALAAPALRSGCAEGLLLPPPEQPAAEAAAVSGQGAEPADGMVGAQARQQDDGQQQKPGEVQPLDVAQGGSGSSSSSSGCSSEQQPPAQQPRPQEAQQQGREQQLGDAPGVEEVEEHQQPRPFLRRRSQMVPMQVSTGVGGRLAMCLSGRMTRVCMPWPVLGNWGLHSSHHRTQPMPCTHVSTFDARLFCRAAPPGRSCPTGRQCAPRPAPVGGAGPVGPVHPGLGLLGVAHPQPAASPPPPADWRPPMRRCPPPRLHRRCSGRHGLSARGLPPPAVWVGLAVQAAAVHGPAQAQQVGPAAALSLPRTC